MAEQWNQILDYTYTGNIASGQTIPDGLVDSVAGSYKVLNGILQRVTTGFEMRPRYLASSTYPRHKVEIWATALPNITATQPGDFFTVGAMDLYRTTDQHKVIGMIAHAGNAPQLDGLTAGYADGTNIVGTRNTFTPIGPVYLLFTTDVVDADGTDGTATLTDNNGPHTQTYTNQTYAPSPGLPGLFMKGNELPDGSGITRIRISGWGEPPVVAQPLAVTAGIGLSTTSGTTINISGPVVSGGAASAPITYQWYYTETATGTGTVITGQSGSVAAGTTQIPGLAWNVPNGQQDRVLYFYCSISDGTTSIPGIGRSAQYTGVGANGVYTAGSAPVPTSPNNTALTTLFNPSTGITTGKAIVLLVGDSITEQGLTYHQAVWSAIGGGKVTLINAGHSGTAFDHWLPSNTNTGTSQLGRSRINGVDASTAINNYNGAIAAIQAAYTSGDAVIVSFALGINALQDSQATARFDTIVSAFNTDLATIAGTKYRLVPQDLPVQRRLTEQYNSILGQIDTLPTYFFAAGDASSTDRIITGTKLSRRFSAARQDLLIGGLHPDEKQDGTFTGATTEGRDSLVRFQTAGILPAMESAYNPADTTAPTVSSVVINSDGTSGTVTFSESVTGALTNLTLLVAGALRGVTYSGNSATVGATRTFTLASAVYQGQAVTRSYTGTSIVDTATTPNALAAFSNVSTGITNNSTVQPPDTVVPTITNVVVNTDGLGGTITFSEVVTGSFTGFTFNVGGSAKSATFSGSGATRSFSFTTPNVYQGQAVTRSYSGTGIVDGSGNALAAFSNVSATNNSTTPAPDTTAPGITSAVIAANGLTLTVTLNEAGTGADGFGVTVGGVSRTVNGWTRATATTVVGTLASAVYSTDTALLSYNAGTGSVTDTAGNEVVSFSGMAITNNSTQTAPVQGGGELTGEQATTLANLASMIEVVGGVPRFKSFALTEVPAPEPINMSRVNLEFNPPALPEQLIYQEIGREVFTLTLNGNGKNWPNAVEYIPIRIVAGPPTQMYAPTPAADNVADAQVYIVNGTVYAEVFIGDEPGTQLDQLVLDGSPDGTKWKIWAFVDGATSGERLRMPAGIITVYGPPE